MHPCESRFWRFSQISFRQLFSSQVRSFYPSLWSRWTLKSHAAVGLLSADICRGISRDSLQYTGHGSRNVLWLFVLCTFVQSWLKICMSVLCGREVGPRGHVSVCVACVGCGVRCSSMLAYISHFSLHDGMDWYWDLACLEVLVFPVYRIIFRKYKNWKRTRYMYVELISFFLFCFFSINVFG